MGKVDGKEMGEAAGSVRSGASADPPSIPWIAVLDRLWSDSPDQVYLCDREGRYLYVSPAAAEAGGLTQDNLRGRNWREAGLPAGLRDTIAPMWERVMAEGQRVAWKVDHSAGTRARALDLVLFPVGEPGDSTSAVVLTIRDAPSEGQFETELRQSHERQRELAKTVSHDLRTPLTAIIGHGQLLQRALRREGLDPKFISSTETIVNAAARMDRMIVDLVESTRLEIGQIRTEKEAVDLAAFIQDLLGRHQEILASGRVETAHPSESVVACVDPHHLERILTSLLTNAIKYSPPGSEIHVRSSRRNGDAVISVEDRGQGIPKEEIPHLFDRFFRTKGMRKAEGLGLGLYIARMLVEAQGGRIWVESEPGRGSTFFVALPVSTSGKGCS